MSPYNPIFSSSFPFSLMAVVIKTRSPQIVGHDNPNPGMGVFHFGALHFSGVREPSATPRACHPRKPGQCRLVVLAANVSKQLINRAVQNGMNDVAAMDRLKIEMQELQTAN